MEEILESTDEEERKGNKEKDDEEDQLADLFECQLCQKRNPSLTRYLTYGIVLFEGQG